LTLHHCARPGDRAGFFVRTANRTFAAHRQIPESGAALSESRIDGFLFSGLYHQGRVVFRRHATKKHFVRTSSELQFPPSPAAAAAALP
jgi:hypothetical protein